MLRSHYRVELLDRWQGEAADVMVALHARRSAESISRWSHDRPGHPLAVVLTGTDLYRDIHVDPAAQRSLDVADRLIVLHETAVADLPVQYQAKAVVCLQSTSTRLELVKTKQHLRCIMVGHLREEKAPRTYFAAARRLTHRRDILLDHVGEALDLALGEEAWKLQNDCPHYRWLGAISHETTRGRIQSAHVLVHTSHIEGGAHVVMEAICSGTPVLATRIAGNIGMLGVDYRGYFEPSDCDGLVKLIERCRDEVEFIQELRDQCAARAPLFEPARERTQLLTILNDLLGAVSPARAR